MSKEAAGGGIGLGGIVFVVLLILKLTEQADLSWFWVFFPLWIGLAVVLGVLGCIAVVGLLIAGVAGFLDWIEFRARRRRTK